MATMRLNTYAHDFTAVCPNNKDIIKYHLKIDADYVIMAERIERECVFVLPAYHEYAADILSRAFGGDQTLTARHGDVLVTTRRSVIDTTAQRSAQEAA